MSIWGWSCHLVLLDCNPEAIRSGENIAQSFEQLVRDIKMTQYGKPQLVHFGKDPKVTGWSANLFLEESNITGHFVEGDNSAHIDVFSCKQFNSDELAKKASEYFGAKKVKYIVLTRGTQLEARWIKTIGE